MINSHSFTKEWIESQEMSNSRQVEIIEKLIQAFSLLEILAQQDFDFIFKGGSSLLLHFDDFHRFSVDIDIMINPDQLNQFLSYIKSFSNEHFYAVLEDKRKPSLLQKVHYKFYYNSVLPTTNPKPTYVILDVVIDEIPYQETIEKEIKLKYLDHQAPYAKVRIPSPDEMLGDKLTAFAPTTIGIRYDDEKFTEIIKQLYDCAKLFQVSTNFDLVIKTYNEIGKRELAYREISDKTISDCLVDTLNACKLILSEGKTGLKMNFGYLIRGITGFSNFVTDEFNIHSAKVCAMKVYVCSIMIQAGGKNQYFKQLEDFDPAQVKAGFLTRGDIKLLRTISGDFYEKFIEAVWVENKMSN